jgi:hypothetical protein
VQVLAFFLPLLGFALFLLPMAVSSGAGGFLSCLDKFCLAPAVPLDQRVDAWPVARHWPTGRHDTACFIHYFYFFAFVLLFRVFFLFFRK